MFVLLCQRVVFLGSTKHVCKTAYAIRVYVYRLSMVPSIVSVRPLLMQPLLIVRFGRPTVLVGHVNAACHDGGPVLVAEITVVGVTSARRRLQHRMTRGLPPAIHVFPPLRLILGRFLPSALLRLGRATLAGLL